MPTPVDKYFDQVKKDNPSYSDEQAWATAWSIYCKHKNPGSEHCHKPSSEYLKGKSAARAFQDEVIVRNVVARFASGPELPIELRIWNAMTGDERVQVAKDADAFKQKTDLKILRACHAYIKNHLDKYKHVKVATHAGVRTARAPMEQNVIRNAQAMLEEMQEAEAKLRRAEQFSRQLRMEPSLEWIVDQLEEQQKSLTEFTKNAADALDYIIRD